MNLKKIRSTRWFQIASNKYVLVLSAFIFWMLFLDSNSWLIHRELNKEIESLKKSQQYHLEQIEKDKAIIERLSDPFGLEKYARQEYYMKRENEEIFIIEYADSSD